MSLSASWRLRALTTTSSRPDASVRLVVCAAATPVKQTAAAVMRVVERFSEPLVRMGVPPGLA